MLRSSSLFTGFGFPFRLQQLRIFRMLPFLIVGFWFSFLLFVERLQLSEHLRFQTRLTQMVGVSPGERWCRGQAACDRNRCVLPQCWYHFESWDLAFERNHLGHSVVVAGLIYNSYITPVSCTVLMQPWKKHQKYKCCYGKYSSSIIVLQSLWSVENKNKYRSGGSYDTVDDSEIQRSNQCLFRNAGCTVVTNVIFAIYLPQWTDVL